MIVGGSSFDCNTISPFSRSLSSLTNIDFLSRSKPRINGHNEGPIAPSHDPEERLQQIIHAISNLESSYLTIQGPPGAGKSYFVQQKVAAMPSSLQYFAVLNNRLFIALWLLLAIPTRAPDFISSAITCFPV
jgi:predicted NACHT family NTPase